MEIEGGWGWVGVLVAFVCGVRCWLVLLCFLSPECCGMTFRLIDVPQSPFSEDNHLGKQQKEKKEEGGKKLKNGIIRHCKL